MSDPRDDLRWFLSHQDVPPSRLHVRGVWRVPRPDDRDPEGAHEAGKGSLIGSPAAAHEFTRWLERGLRSTIVDEAEEPCFHVGAPQGQLCVTCGVRDETGAVAFESGVKATSREYYRWPMRVALSRVHGAPVAAGLPRLSELLRAVAAQGGDVARAIETLTYRYPLMADPGRAIPHLRRALRRVRQVYALEKIDLPRRPKSESQLAAEAA